MHYKKGTIAKFWTITTCFIEDDKLLIISETEKNVRKEHQRTCLSNVQEGTSKTLSKVGETENIA